MADDLVTVGDVSLCMTVDEDFDDVLTISIPYSATSLNQSELQKLIETLQDFDDEWGY